MAYERRAASFTFMGAVPLGKTVEVVPDREDHPVLMRPMGPRPQGATVTMRAAELARTLRTHQTYLRGR